MRTVLIHAYECAPYHRPGSTIGAQRPYQFAKHLPKFGWRAIVLCCDFSRRYSLEPKGAWKEIVEQQVLDALDSWNGMESLTIALPSLQYADWVDRLWLKTVILDTEKGIFSPKPGFGRGLVRKISTFLKLFRGDHSQSWQKVVLLAAETLQKRGWSIDVQLAEHGPDASLFIARKLRERIPAIFDFRDPVDRDMNLASKFIFWSFVFKKFQFPKGVINVNEVLTAIDEKKFKKPTIKISNGFDLEDFFNFPEKLDQELLCIGWFGNIQSGQNIQPFFDALKRLNPEIELKIIFRGSDAFRYQESLKETGKNILLDFKDPVPRKEALRLMQSCDILLLLSLLAPEVEYLSQGLIPGKTFEYLATLNPILVVPGDGAMLDAFISENNYGKIGRNADQIAELIQEAYHQRIRKESIWGIQYTQEDIAAYSRGNQTRKLARFMDQLLST
ncbi:MAG: hypothetical protein R2787_08595 [Saprospiraceae bacterium]